MKEEHVMFLTEQKSALAEFLATRLGLLNYAIYPTFLNNSMI